MDKFRKRPSREPPSRPGIHCGCSPASRLPLGNPARKIGDLTNFKIQSLSRFSLSIPTTSVHCSDDAHSGDKS